jgi:hypothetical protein
MENAAPVSIPATTAGKMADITSATESEGNSQRNKVPEEPPKETPEEKQIKALLFAYGVDPKGLQPGTVHFAIGVVELSDNDGPAVRGTIANDKISNLVWLRKMFCPAANSNLSDKERKLNQSRILLTTDPMIALAAASKGLPAIAFDKAGMSEWTKNVPPQPTWSDVQHVTIPQDVVDVIKGKCVFLAPDLAAKNLRTLGLRYHVPILRLMAMKSEGADLTEANLIDAVNAATEVERHYDSYPYEKYNRKSLNYYYPMFDPANDEILPEIVMDAVTYDADGNEVIIKKKLDGIPLARSEATLILVQGKGSILSLDKSDGGNSVREQMVGVTATHHVITWIHSAEDYQLEGLLGRGFTAVNSNRLQDWRNFLACQKGSKKHKVRYATDRKGWYGTFSGGKQTFPAGYIQEGKVARVPGTEEVTPVGSSVRETLQDGTLEGWCRITRAMLHNPNLAALMGFAVSGIFLVFVSDAEPGIIHLVAKSGFGKTTTNRFIASLTSAPLQPGSPGSPIYTYRTTENGMEGPLAARNDCHFLLDEIGAASAHMDWTAFVYMMQGGKGKSRAKTDGSERESKVWRVQVLSTGEVTFSSLLASQKKSERGGLLFRFLDLHLADVPFYADIKAAIESGDLGRYREIVESYAPGASSISGVLDAAMRGYEEHHGHMWMHLANALLDPEVRVWTVQRYKHWFEYFTAKVKEVDRIVHRRSKHLASAMTGLELLLRNFSPVVEDAEATEIIDGARQWLEKYVWRAGLPNDSCDEGEAIAEKFMQHLRANPHRFLRQATKSTDEPRTSLWGWETRLKELFVPASSFAQICVDINEDKARVKHAMLNLSPEQKWTYVQARPQMTSKGSPVWGLESPVGFTGSFRDFM